jgi:hypothetical protein
MLWRSRMQSEQVQAGPWLKKRWQDHGWDIDNSKSAAFRWQATIPC